MLIVAIHQMVRQLLMQVELRHTPTHGRQLAETQQQQLD
jgi:hypothetical protein